MIKSILALVLSAQVCTIDTSNNDFGTARCLTSTGATANISSSVYDLTKARCSINEKDVVKCTNVRVTETNVFLTLLIDLKNSRSTVY